MPLTDRLLLGPGPSNPYPEVAAAFARPLLGHLDPDFLAILDETCDRLRTVFRTSNALTLPVSGTGSAGMEACFVNLVEPGDTVVIGVNGVFGARMCEVARRCGAEVVRIDAPWGTALDPQRLLDAQRDEPGARLVAVVHAETSTGVENDVEPLRALQATDTLLLVDTVTSLGGIPLDVDGWGIDACYSGTQKCLGVPPGLAPLTFSPRVVERVRTRETPPQSWYLDLGLIGDYVGGARKYHHTAPTGMIVALHAGLGAVLDEGLEAAWARPPGGGHPPAGLARRARVVVDRRRRSPASAAHVDPASRRNRRGRAAKSAAHGVRDRGRRGSGRVRRDRLEDRADGAFRPGTLGHHPARGPPGADLTGESRPLRASSARVNVSTT